MQVETQGSQIQMQQMEAEQAALLGLQIALGELQKTAGPDTRVTATAEVLNDSTNVYTGGTTPVVGQGSWTGVWKSDTVANGTPSYSPANPDARQFVGWLVSSANDATGEFELPTTLNAVSAASADSVALARDSTGIAYSLAEKVRVGSEGNTYFAFHVEDESVKADLSWSETPATGSGPLAQSRAQARRLSAASGPDFGALNGVDDNGPFGSVTYPLTIDSSAILNDVLKVQNPADLTTTMSNASDASNWLKDNRGDMTWGSRGVMADVKWGGLRRDLNLAFEMDGDDDVDADGSADTDTAILEKFNAQTGEFVGGSDQLSGQYNVPGMSVRERFLYRVTKSDGTPFSSGLLRSDSVVRGPNWWALRDYYNLYKRLEGSSGNYTIPPRSYYPNNSAGIGNTYRQFGQPSAGFTASLWDDEVTVSNKYIFHPARANYAPILMGAVGLYSAKVTNGNLTLAIDPLIYLWNPYNISLDVRRYGVAMQRGHGGKITFKVMS